MHCSRFSRGFCGQGVKFNSVPSDFIENPILLEERQRVLKNDKGMDHTIYYDPNGYEMAIFKEYSQDECNEGRLLRLVSQKDKRKDGRTLLSALIQADIALHMPILHPKVQEGIVNCLSDLEMPPMQTSAGFGELCPLQLHANINK